MFKIVIKDNIAKKRGWLIVLSIMSALIFVWIFMFPFNIATILSIINIIILLFNKNVFHKKPKTISPAEQQKSTKKELLLGVIVIVTYIFGLAVIPLLVSIEYSMTINTILLIDSVFSIATLIIGVLCFKDKLKKDLKLFKENFKVYFKYVATQIGMMYVFYIVASIICQIICGQTKSVNQTSLEAAPIWYLLLLTVWAPIVEELVFRGALRRLINNQKIFIVLSAVLFGLLHTTSESSLINGIIMGIPYAIAGGFYAHIYAKTNNLTNCIAAHLFHNVSVTIISLINL